MLLERSRHDQQIIDVINGEFLPKMTFIARLNESTAVFNLVGVRLTVEQESSVLGVLRA
jgi:hypothetical protein